MSNRKNATEYFVQHVLDTQYENLSAQAINTAKIFCLDTLGVTLAGTGAPFADSLRQAVALWGTGADASVLGLGDKLPAPHAALINGFHAHCQEYDCVHERAVVHPLASIQSALLAFAERRGQVSGREFILALCLGVDVATSLGVAAKTGLRFFRPATAGIFGATAGVARLAGLGRDQLLDAMGLALAQSSGTMQAHVEGKPTLAMLVGLAACRGIQAVDLAAAGMAGPHDVLEGPFGYFPLLEGEWELEPVLADLGKIWRICEVSHKPFPCGRANHAGIDGIQQLKTAGLNIADIEKLELHAPPLIHQLVGRPIRDVMQVSYARLCFQYVGALALMRDTVDVLDFQAQSLQNKDLRQLADRISVVIDQNPDPNALTPQKIIVYLRNGEQKTLTVNATLGSPSNPLSFDAHLDKFRRCWRYCRQSLREDNCERVIASVETLDNLDDISVVLELLRP